MADPVSLVISSLSLAVSAATAWLTLFRRGDVKMTQPTTIFFGPDASRSQQDTPPPKVYLRCLLFSTSKRGRVIENMYIKLSRNEAHQNFNVWVYGERKELVRGSGLFVGETGISANHHFLTPKDGNAFRFTEGRYELEVYAHLLGDARPQKLFSQTLELSREAAAEMAEKTAGLYFDWGPDSSRYLAHIDERPPAPNMEEFFRLFGEDEPPEARGM